jgi:hypothetical protein
MDPGLFCFQHCQQIGTSGLNMTESLEQTYTLQTGNLTVSIDANQSSMGLNELFKVAERYNPKRSFLFISTLLGKHYPTAVNHMNTVVRQLTDELPEDIKRYAVIGMAETAIGLGAAVYQNCINRYGDGLFGTSTRYPHTASVNHFSEPHSHASEQWLCSPDTAELRRQLSHCEDLVLVDDELTTGRTISNLANVLIKHSAPNVKRIFILSLTDWSPRDLQLELSRDISIKFYSLVKGRYHWSGNGNHFELPNFTDSTVAINDRMASIRSPRNWINSLDDLAIIPDSVNTFMDSVKPGNKVLVVGTGEFMAKPLHVAQCLERKGAKAFLSSTTRSPAMTDTERGYFNDYGVKSRLSFNDLYQRQGANYLYNTDIEGWDKILLYTDASACAIPSALKSNLKPDVIASEFELLNRHQGLQ